MSDPVGSAPALGATVIDQDGELDAGVLGRAAWVTDVGKVRARNEDRLLVKDAFDERFLLLVVADGAGGHNSGDKAATTVVLALDTVFRRDGPPPEGPPAKWLNDAILDAHEQVRALAKGENRPPASTLVGLLVERETLCGWRFHVGDSRLYGQQDDGPPTPWTRDHNITNGLIDRGLPVAQAMKIAEGGKLTQVMGGGTSPEPEIRGPFQLAAGNSFILCSDGVDGYNDDRDVLTPALDTATGSALERAVALKAAVLAGDALDNLTAVIWDLPAGITTQRQRLGLVDAYDRAAVNTMVGIAAQKRGAGTFANQVGGPTGPPPPQSMPNIRSVSDTDAAVATPKKGRSAGSDAMATASLAPTAADLQRAQAAIARPPGSSPGFIFGILLMLALVFLAIAGWLRRQDPDATLTVDQMDAQRAAARELRGLPAEPAPASAPESTPPTGEPVQRGLDALVGGFEPQWWSAVEESRRNELLKVLRELLSGRAASWTTLRWEQGDPPASMALEYPDWPIPGGDNGRRAADAWAARGRVLSMYGDLASQPGMPDLLREVACDQVRRRWPRGGSAGGGEGTQLGSWLAACLPAGVQDASVTVRLGAWPDVGWRTQDLDALVELGAAADGGQRLRAGVPGEEQTGRMMEIAQLARALTLPSLADLEVELRVLLPSTTTVPEAVTQERAAQVARALSVLLHDATGLSKVAAVGAVGEPLVEPTALPPLTAGQAAHVEGLNRRVEVTLFRSSPLDPDEGPEDVELPGAAQVSTGPAVVDPDAGGSASPP